MSAEGSGARAGLDSLEDVIEVALTVGLALERDGLFTLVSLFVLCVLAFGIWLAVRR